ncbi:hypothetical protein [Phyllobacterium myrsinacearum]|uniref:Uncharacterized protein n=1 Tax=Phyllobacterium myrsinacearum TaxID=28101 RepID=A0A839ESH7_9HYPH|nr:hypothetical protein [Phyllobacterium myrsinacearum]MBA8881752.1 hypothetical protein [Phyllobacterium myrsinacearum]
MNFKFRRDYQNKQDETITVLYIPEDARCNPLALVFKYSDFKTQEELDRFILAHAPLEAWQRAIDNANQIEFEIGNVEATAEDVQKARDALGSTATDMQSTVEQNLESSN